MTDSWEVVFLGGIYFFGGLFLLTTTLGWLRTIKKYWRAEANRNRSTKEEGEDASE